MDHLTTIPEDVSVAASAQNPETPRSITNLSTASAVASSDSDEYDDFVGGTGRRGGGGRGKKRRQGSGVLTNATANGVEVIRDGDNISETHASLGGADGAAAAAALGRSRRHGQRGMEEARKKPPTDLSWLLKCTKKSMIFYSIVALLLIIIVVGIYFIVDNVSSNNNDNGNPNDANDSNSSSTSNPQFPDFEYLESEFPTASPSYNLADVMATDLALLQVSGTNEQNLYDVTTPQGSCRYWLIHVDQEQLRVDEVGDARVQQRYIACVLYYATSGDHWTAGSNYLNPALHECDWDGVICNLTNVAHIDLAGYNLSGTIPLELESMSTLEAIDFQDNSIAGTIPNGLFDSLERLTWIGLSRNRIGGTIPAPREGSTPKLENIYLSKNQLEGTLPFFPNIVAIRFESNKLTAIDPRYATSAIFMKKFSGYDNQLSGLLPTVWNAPVLQTLDIGVNGWTGPIPTGLWNLPSLRSLVLDDCQLTGTLPSFTIGTSFQDVWLFSNQLEGTIPSTFGSNWLKLNSLLLYDNGLIGGITDDHCNEWPLWQAYETNETRDNDDWRCEIDCNDVDMTCACCTKCHPDVSGRRRHR